MEMARERIYSLLQRCKKVAGARHVHGLMLTSGLHSVPVLADHLIRIFASFQSLLEAQLAFCSVIHPSLFTWHSIIAAHSTLGQSKMAIHLYFKLQAEGIQPDKFIFTCILKACADAGAIDLGIHIHNLIIEHRLESDVVVGSALILLYSKCGASDDANKVFVMLLNRNAVSWNTLIAHFNKMGCGDTALHLYGEMQQHGIKPSVSTFSSVLKTCASIGAVDQGKLIHEQVLKSGLELNVVVGSTLINMYSKCGDLKVAREAFERMQNRDVVSWGAMISGYVEHSDYQSALKLFARLLQEDITPNKVILVCIVKACASRRAAEHAMWIHHHIIELAAECDEMVGSTLVDMYAWCGSLNEALKVFTMILERDVVSWNAMIGGYAQHGHGRDALLLFCQMQRDFVKPDKITFLGVSKACGIVGGSCQGRMVHHQILKDGFDSDISVGSALVDMYAKCGSVQEAHTLFDKLSEKNIVTWGALITGYAQLGYHELVDRCLQNMIQEGLTPSPIIYVNVFASCSHAGRVEDSKKYFKAMVITHCVTPSQEHFNGIIDVFGRAGCLVEGKKLLQSMPIHANFTCWMSLLTACGTYGVVDLARECFDELVKMDPDYASAYVLMTKIYTDMNMWEHADKIKQLKKGLWMEEACS
ncbi:hypothetical protein GOP47_0027807 [Adiantum capillus-veneris]|nr:hypothetical protein GOP47_0027807 [Adiantum capillus-veneris]